MAEATTTISVTPKQLGKHLRSIRRKKGLSLSEVARGAGLSRRELVAYERGKAPIPESDLWVLAGSCGVDVSELMPATSSLELTAAASGTSVGDAVSQLRRSQEDAGITPYLHTLHKLQALPAGKRIPLKERELEAIAAALGSTPRSIEQRLQEVLHVSPDEAERLRAMILVPPNGRGKPRALAASPSALAAAAAPPPVATPAPAPAPAEAPPLAAVPTSPPFAGPFAGPFAAPPAAAAASAPFATEPVQAFPAAPAAFRDTPLDAPIDARHGNNVDVFAELARLPEPVPLADPSGPLPDLLAPPDQYTEPLVGVQAMGPPDGAVELVDSSMPTTTGGGAGGWNAADAPPIDVAMRQGSSTWDLGQPPLVAKSAPVDNPTAWETTGWQPPAPDGTHGAPGGFWEGTDDWAPPADPSQDTWAGSAWDPQPWSTPPDADADVDPWGPRDWAPEPADRGAWDHHPDPAAVDTGFYVDWGAPETDAPPAWDVFADPAAAPASPADERRETSDPFATFTDAAVFQSEETFGLGEAVDAGSDPRPAWDTWSPTGPAGLDEVPLDTIIADTTIAEPMIAHEVLEPAFDDAPEPVVPLAPISWRADVTEVTDAPAGALDVPVADASPVAPIPQPEWTVAVTDVPSTNGGSAPAPVPAPPLSPLAGAFVTAGPDWQLGNALPLVEVRGQGGLVMRRADERWALADVTTSADFVAEVEVDFRSGPGLGVLFRASTDHEGRMSGYSFDIDPIYDGGGYLVRQWQADRELWNPIARVRGDDPGSMHGTLLVRLELVGEHLRAVVNGVEVLTVENLAQASVERGRDAASGDRVGVQAWSSTDLVIDTVRVAAAH